ncbi:MAG: hypothetical protein GXO83_08000 [Chlorobi bacterium]|nr:hypothetical protein [Chlorobiota bacterium]
MKRRSRCRARYFTVCFMLLIAGLQAFGQKMFMLKEKTNTIHLDGATLLFAGMYSLNYEKTIFLSDNISMMASAGIGGWYFTTISQWVYGTSFPLSINNLIGKGDHHFEIDFGLRYTLFNKNSDKGITPFFPVFNLGYRYQRRDGKGLVFRSFIGLSGAGIGIGKAF